MVSMNKYDIIKMTKVKSAANSDSSESASGNQILSQALNEFKGDHYNFDKGVFWETTTGSLLLDSATGGVNPSLWRLCGANNSGKTPQMLEIVRNILKNIPNSKCLWMIAEGRGLSEENRARCGLTFVYDPKEWVSGTVFILQSNIFELFIKIVKDLVKNNEAGIRYAFVIDSVDGLILRDDAAKDVTENNKVAGVPALSKKMLQSLSLGMFKFGHWMGLISQVTAEIKLDPYAKSFNRSGQFSGGNSLLHGPDVIIEYNPPFAGDFILNNPNGKFNDGKTKPIGQNVRVTLSKSIKETTRKTQVIYPIRYGRKPSGIWTEREVGDLVFTWGLANRTGAWISFQDDFRKELMEVDAEVPEKIQGVDNFYGYLEGNPSVTDFLKSKFIKLLQ